MPVPDDSKPLLDVEAVTRRYTTDGGAVVEALRGVSFRIDHGEYVALTGPSGCGKSTLLNQLAALDRPDSGRILFDGVDLGAMDEAARTQYRREAIGIVFQFFNLLPTLTVEENVALPLRLQAVPAAERLERARALLDFVGLADRARQRPSQLSGGEMQRTAVARALVHNPRLLIADEPTGNLDSAAAGRVLELFARIHEDSRTTLLVVTHSAPVAGAATRRLALRDGQLVVD